MSKISLKNKVCVVDYGLLASNININCTFDDFQYLPLPETIRKINHDRLRACNDILLKKTYDIIYVFDNSNHKELEYVYLVYLGDKCTYVTDEETFFKSHVCKIWEKDKGFLIDLNLFDYV